MIQAWREKHIQYLVAPFEADAQLTFLSWKGFVQLVISEDSDLLVFGCKQVFAFTLAFVGITMLFTCQELKALCQRIFEYNNKS